MAKSGANGGNTPSQADGGGEVFNLNPSFDSASMRAQNQSRNGPVIECPARDRIEAESNLLKHRASENTEELHTEFK